MYVLKKQDFKDGTSRWVLGIELKWDDSKFMVLDAIRGTKEEAVKRLEEIVINGK